MSTPTSDKSQPPAVPSSRDIAGAGNPFADLLSSADLGIRIKGLVTAKDAPRELSGTSKGGKPYSFVNQTVTLLAGAETVNVTIRKDKVEDLPPINLYSVRTFTVTGGRVFNGVLTYDVEVAG